MVQRRWLVSVTGAAAMTLTSCQDAEGLAQSSGAGSTVPIPRAEQPAACPSEGAALQVLGSGGPIAEAARAATSYLLWIDGTPRLLIDAGSGSFLRFAEAGGKIETLDAILLTHLHVDHAGDLIDIFNTGGFEGRSEPLPVIGPDAAPRFPGTTEFLSRLLSKDSGAFAYNGGYLDGTENKPLLEPRDIATAEGTADIAGLDLSNDYSVMAIPVHHGPVPALGYEISIGEEVIFITGDQSAFSEVFDGMVASTRPTILFAHHVINGEEGQPRGLHRTPAEIGELAALAQAERLVLTHNMERSLAPIADSLAAIKENYSGDVSVAIDLDCYAL